MARRHTAAQRRRGDIWTRVVLLACLAYAGLNLARLGIQEVRLARQHWFLAREQQAVDFKRSSLQKQVAEARSYRGTEYLARKVLVMAKPDEIPVVYLKGAVPRIVHFRDEPAAPAAPPAPHGAALAKAPAKAPVKAPAAANAAAPVKAPAVANAAAPAVAALPVPRLALPAPRPREAKRDASR